MDQLKLRGMLILYGEACYTQGSVIQRHGFVSAETTEATNNRTRKFADLEAALGLANLAASGSSRLAAVTKPVVTTLCGSSRFPDLHMQVMMALTLQGRVVIPLGCYGHADVPTGARFLTSDGDESTPEKRRLDELHFRKIEMSDGIFVVNPGGYVGSSTIREIGHAKHLGKTVEYLFPERG